MSVNVNHVKSLLEPLCEDGVTAEDLRGVADGYDGYVSRGKTYRDPRTGEAVSDETLRDVSRLLRERAETVDRGMTIGEIAAEQNAEPDRAR